MLIHENGAISLLFIPEWLNQALVDNNKPLSSLLSIDDMKTFLTKEDITNFIYINRRIGNASTRIMNVLNSDFQTPAASAFALSDRNSDFKFCEDIEIGIELQFNNSTSNIDIGDSVKSNLLPNLEAWEYKSLLGEVDLAKLADYGIYSFNTSMIHNNVYGIRFTTESGEDSAEYRTYTSLDKLLNNISQYYDFRNLVGLKTFQTYLEFMDLVN